MIGTKVNGTTKHYVKCDKCFANGDGKEKPDIDSIFAFGADSLYWARRRNRALMVAMHFWNGLVYGMPICCNIYFCKHIYHIEKVAAVTEYMRGVRMKTWERFIGEEERDYIERIRRHD